MRSVKKFVDLGRLGSNKINHLDIEVEMIAEELTLTKYLSLVPAELLAQGLEKDWPSIKAKVFQILERYSGTKGHMTAISLFRLGFSLCDAENPNTVYISVDYESEESTWPPVVSEIQQYLQRYEYANLCVHLEHNTVEHLAFPLLPSRPIDEKRKQKQALYNLIPKTPYKTAVDLGDDIGTSNYLALSDGQSTNPLIGTLGCWLEIKSDKFPDWTKVALINYHIIRTAYNGFRMNAGGTRIKAPVDNSTLMKHDMDGVRWESSAPKLEHPARCKHNNGVQRLHNIIKNFPEQSSRKDQDELDQMVAFFDQGNHIFGTVYCASGFTRRTASNGRLDWALVMPLDKARIGKNTLPSFRDWTGKYVDVDQYPTSQAFDGLKQPPQAGLRAIEHGDKVYKVGASTGFTIGAFSRLTPDVQLTDDKHVAGVSEEFAFVSSATSVHDDKRLATLGDSGSVVWNKESRAVGLLFRGQNPRQLEKEVLSYVIPIEDVFADIKAFSNGGIKEIRIAEG